MLRLRTGELVAGLDPRQARAIARACAGRRLGVEAIALHVKIDSATAKNAVERLVDEGYLRPSEATDARYANEDDLVCWTTTIAGSALAMASFNAPINRVKAEALLVGALERARAYNTNKEKPYFISELRVFGSYLDATMQKLGDLDLAVQLTLRQSVDALEYAQACDRRFATFTDMLAWPRREPIMLLRNRSAYTNVHDEDISKFTDRWIVVLEYSE